MKFKRAIIIAAMLLVVGGASQSFAFRGILIPVPVPIVPVPVAPVYVDEPVVFVPGPFFYEGFWWWNDGGVWRRSHSQHGPWGRSYRGRIPYGVSHYHHGGHDGHRSNDGHRHNVDHRGN